MSKTFSKRSVWHSDLRAASPLVVRFMGDVTVSQFKDREPYAGGLYIDFQVAGDSATYSYNIENEVIEHQMSVIRALAENPGGWIKVTAIGTRAEAELICEEPAAQEIPPEAAEGYRSVERAAEHALMLSGRLHKKFEREFGQPPTETETSFAISLLIRSENTGLPITEIEAQLNQLEQEEVQQPTTDGTGATPASDEELAELCRLAETVEMTDHKREEFETWVNSGDVTRIDYVKTRDWLRSQPALTT